MDERVSFRNGLSFSHGGGEAHDYLTGLVSRCLSALTGLQQLDLCHNLIRVSQLQHIVSNMHGSLRDLALAMHVLDKLHDATHDQLALSCDMVEVLFWWNSCPAFILFASGSSAGRSNVSQKELDRTRSRSASLIHAKDEDASAHLHLVLI